MAVHTLKNQYLGINAHLHSLLQAEGGWDEFHTSHIVHLNSELKLKLRPLGYTTGLEQSLQIRRNALPAGKPISDVTIYDPDPLRPWQASSPALADTHQLVLTLPEIFEDEEDLAEYRAIAIYEAQPPKSDLGEPVAWLELLSPSNKPGGQDALYYQKKRHKLLESGLVFVELDYLHESAPTFRRLPSYRRKEDAHPYRILVIDPRPAFNEGQLRAYQFDVDEPFPPVPIPLNAGDVLVFDFGSPYTKTFEEVLYGDWVDYGQFPKQFQHYVAADQRRIMARMLTVLQAFQQGKNLEVPPSLVPTVSLEEGLAQLAALGISL